MADPVIMRRLHEAIASHAAAIEDMFTEPVKITVLVRNPAYPDGARDVLVSNDDYQQAIAAIRTVITTGEEVK